MTQLSKRIDKYTSEVFSIADGIVKESKEHGYNHRAKEIYVIKAIEADEFIDDIEESNRYSSSTQLISWLYTHGYKDKVISFLNEITLLMPLYIDDLLAIMNCSEFSEKMLTALGFVMSDDFGTWIDPTVSKEDYIDEAGNYDRDAYIADAMPLA